MSELRERRWAVQSERGLEGAGLSYEEAARVIARLGGERVSGLCVITDEAAGRMKPAAAQKSKPAGKGKPAAGARPRRGGKKSAS